MFHEMQTSGRKKIVPNKRGGHRVTSYGHVIRPQFVWKEFFKPRQIDRLSIMHMHATCHLHIEFLLTFLRFDVPKLDT